MNSNLKDVFQKQNSLQKSENESQSQQDSNLGDSEGMMDREKQKMAEN